MMMMTLNGYCLTVECHDSSINVRLPRDAAPPHCTVNSCQLSPCHVLYTPLILESDLHKREVWFKCFTLSLNGLIGPLIAWYCTQSYIRKMQPNQKRAERDVYTYSYWETNRNLVCDFYFYTISKFPIGYTVQFTDCSTVWYKGYATY